MRKFFALFVLVFLLLSLTGCQTAKVTQTGTPYCFYYAAGQPQFCTPSGALGYEIRDVGPDDMAVEKLMELYLQGPESHELVSPFPKPLPIQACDMEAGTLYITFGDEFSSLKGIHLSLATACINQTFLQLEGIEEVVITTPSGMISAQERSALGRDSFLFYDESAGLFERTVKVYHSDVNRQYLIEEQKDLQFVSQEDVPVYVMELLAAGPASAAARPALPADTRLLSLQLEDGVCTVDLSQEFSVNRPVTVEESLVAIYSIVNSLTALEEVEAVELLVEGSPLKQYGTITLPEQLHFTKSLVSG